MTSVFSKVKFRHCTMLLALSVLSGCGGGSGTDAGTAVAPEGRNGLATLATDAGPAARDSLQVAQLEGQSQQPAGADGQGQAGQPPAADTEGNGGNGTDGSGTAGSGADSTGNAGDQPTTPPAPTEVGPGMHYGKFIVPIEGLNYLLAGNGFYTDSLGNFAYATMDGVAAPVVFRVGGVVLGSVVPHDCLSPLSLVAGAETRFNSDNTIAASAVALMRLLLALDEDNDPANGIKITTQTHFLIYSNGETLHQAAVLDPASADFATDTNLQNLVAALNRAAGTDKYVLAGAEAARQMLARALGACHAVRYEGNYLTAWEHGGVNIGTVNQPVDPNPQAFSIVITPALPNDRFSGTLMRYGVSYDVGGLVDASGGLVFETMRRSSDKIEFNPALDGHYEGQFDKASQTLKIQFLKRISPLV
ncbi:MAG: hypothetical protein ACRYGK_10495 [Janthinobacterium lividum]